jgi:hypothetical protein
MEGKKEVKEKKQFCVCDIDLKNKTARLGEIIDVNKMLITVRPFNKSREEAEIHNADQIKAFPTTQNAEKFCNKEKIKILK